MAILKVAWAGIKKRKVYSISIFLLVFIIAALLNTGVSMRQRISEIYDDTHEMSNSIHIQYFFDEMYGETTKELKEWFRKDSRISEVRMENILWIDDEVFNPKNGQKFDYPVYLYPNPEKVLNRNNEVVNLVLDYNEIALPIYYQRKYQLKVGDSFEFILDDIPISLKIHSFFIDPIHGSDMVSVKNVFVNVDRLTDMIENFRKITDDTMRVKERYYIGVVIKDKFVNNTQEINEDFYKNNDVPMNESYTFEMYKTGSLFMANIILSIMIAFSILLFLIIVIIIRSAINSAIETDYINIGILKGLGFSSLQILIMIILQFSILAFIATILGISTSILFMPFLGNIVFDTTGLIWIGLPSVLTMIAILFILLVIINCFVYVTSRKVMMITPVEAVTQRKSDNYFKSYINISLEKLSLLPLNLRIGLKQILTKARQYIMLVIISIVLSLSIGMALMAASMFSDLETTLNIYGSNMTNIVVTGPDEVTVEKIMEEIAITYDVDYYDLKTITMVSAGSKNIFTLVYKDFEKGNIYPIEGRFPKFDNEVSLTKILSGQLGKKIGDTLIISDVTGKENLEFIITGYHQNISDIGSNIFLPSSGLKRINEKAQLRTGELLINETLDIDKIVKELAEKYETSENGVNILRSDYEGTMVTTIKNVLSGVTLSICILVSFIISIITMLLAFITIHKENKELGIYISQGYDILQIRLQFATRFGTITFIGALIGSTLSSIFGADILGIMLSSIGIGRLVLDFHLLNFLTPVGLVTVVAFLVSFLASQRMKKVSTRDLISE